MKYILNEKILDIFEWQGIKLEIIDQTYTYLEVTMSDRLVKMPNGNQLAISIDRNDSLDEIKQHAITFLDIKSTISSIENCKEQLTFTELKISIKAEDIKDIDAFIKSIDKGIRKEVDIKNTANYRTLKIEKI